MITDAQGTKDGKGAVVGASTGAVVGGLLGATAALALPGVGPILAAGLFASIFGGAVAGSAVGGILGAMTGLGISEAEARYYEQMFASGKAIIAVKAGAREAQAQKILSRHGGYDMHTRRVSPIETDGAFSQP
jgi:hypothetical protein